MSYIKVEDLSLGYDSEIVCSNINFEINKNDYLCIIDIGRASCRERV